MKKTSRSSHSSLNELNITPLLDLAFVLLVIFIITTPQLVNNLEMNLPSAQVPPPMTNTPPKPPHQIVVSAVGDISLNGQAYKLPELKGVLGGLHRADTNLSVVVRGSRDADYQHVVGVLDLIQQLNITRVGLATETAN